MKKLFCCSDIHSFFHEWMTALNRKKFDINNPDHILIICGDIFDRGPGSKEVYDFIKKIPLERRILIRGNHEILLRQLCEKKWAESYDYSNGTLDTVHQLNDWDDERETYDYYKTLMKLEKMYSYNSPEVRLYEQTKGIWNRRKALFSSPVMKEVLKWIASDEWVNYFELEDYIFVHSWIPITVYIDWGRTKLLQEIVKSGPDSYREDWRNATQSEWEDATWGCPWKRALIGLNQTGKTIVCGHWHTSDFYNHLTKQKKDIYDCPVFKSKRYKLIGLDACTAGSGKVNVMTLEISDEEWEKWYVDNHK